MPPSVTSWWPLSCGKATCVHASPSTPPWARLTQNAANDRNNEPVTTFRATLHINVHFGSDMEDTQRLYTARGPNHKGGLVGVISRPVRAGTVAVMGLAITAFTGTLASAGAATPAPGASLGYVALANSVSPTTDHIIGGFHSAKMTVEVALAPRNNARA